MDVNAFGLAAGRKHAKTRRPLPARGFLKLKSQGGPAQAISSGFAANAAA
jgi:hypothetical protein